MLAYLDQLDRVKADRQLEAAEIAMLPAIGQRSREAWWNRQQETAAPKARPVLFTVNGAPVGTAGLKRALRQRMGSGLSLD